MHPSQDSQEGPEVPPQAIEARDGRDLAARDRDNHQHEPSRSPATARLSQGTLSQDTIRLGPEQAPASRGHPYPPPSAYGYPSQPPASSIDHEPGRRPQWPDHAEGDIAEPTLDSNYGQRPPPAWSQSPLSPSADFKTTHAQRHHPYRPALFTPDHGRGYPHPRHLSPQEQRPHPPQEQSQPNLRHNPYRQQQQTHQQHYDQVLSQEYIASQDYLNEDLELGWQQRRQANYNREVMRARYDLHGMHLRATHPGHEVSPLQPPVDDYGRHRHHPPSLYHPHLARPPNRTYSPPGPFSSDSAHRPRSPNGRGGGEGTSPPPGAARAARVDRHSSLPNIEPGPDFSLHAGGSHPRPYFRTSGDVPVARMAAPLDPHGRPYYPEIPPHDPRTGAPPHWAGHPLFNQRFGYYRRGYDYGHDYIYEATRRRQASFGMASRGLAAWDQGADGYYPGLHHHPSWSDRSPPPSWARRHSTDNLGETAQETEDQCHPHSSQLPQEREAGAVGGDISPTETKDLEMEDRTDMDDPKSASASGPHATLGTSQPRTPGEAEASNSSEELYPRNSQEGVTKGKQRTVPGLAPSPSMSTLSASISADGPSSVNPSAATRTPAISNPAARAHQTHNETSNELRKATSLSPSPSPHFPSLSLNHSSSASPKTQLAVSPLADNPASAGVSSDRKWSKRGCGETNHSGSIAEPTVHRLGQEGYYSKRDLEELYKSWRSEFEESRGLRSLPPHLPHQQQDQHNLHRGYEGRKEVDGLNGGGKDIVEEGLDSPYSKRKVKWKTVEFGGSQGKLQQEGGGGEGSSGGQGRRGGDATTTANRRTIAKGSGDKRARLDLSREATSAAATVSEATSCRDKEPSGNKNMDMEEDIGGQEEQEDDGEDGDDDEDGSLSEADSGSASAGDPGPSRRKKDRIGICAPGGPSASDGPPRRIRIQENKSHQCNQCEKRFSRPSQLLTHSFTHSGEKPHQCPHCKRLFNVASNLKRHIRIHSNSKRRSSRNGNVVFRSFAQGTHVTQMVTGTIGSIGANRGGGGGNHVSGSTPVPNDPRRAVAPSPRTPAFDKLRWMNTETPTKGLTAAQQQQQQVHMANYRPIKAKLAAAAAIASSASTSSPSSSSTSATASITPSTTTTRAISLSTPATPMTPSTAVATPATPSSGARSFGSSSGRDSTSTSDTTLTNSSSVPPSSTSTDDGDLPDKPRQQPEGTRVLPPPLILSILSPLPPPAPLP